MVSETWPLMSYTFDMWPSGERWYCMTPEFDIGQFNVIAYCRSFLFSDGFKSWYTGHIWLKSCWETSVATLTSCEAPHKGSIVIVTLFSGFSKCVVAPMYFPLVFLFPSRMLSVPEDATMRVTEISCSVPREKFVHCSGFAWRECQLSKAPHLIPKLKIFWIILSIQLQPMNLVFRSLWKILLSNLYLSAMWLPKPFFLGTRMRHYWGL